MGRGLVRAIIILGDMMCSKKRFIPVILQIACALAFLTHPSHYLSKLLGIPCVAAFSQLELFRVLISLRGNNLLHFRYRFAIDGVT